MTAAAIYTRLSYDPDGSKSGGEQQLEDCRGYCATRGFDVALELDDPDISAYGKRTRPGFERLLKEMEAGNVSVVVVWHTSRLCRRGRDLQRFLNIAEDQKVELHAVTQPEFSGSMGLLVLRMLNGMDEYESAVKSERVARKMKNRAEKGEPQAGGRRMYGYSQDGRSIIHQEAMYLRGAAKSILAGHTLTEVINDWNHCGIRTPGGSSWTAGRLSRVLRAPRIAGYRTYHGEFHEGNWPPILARATWRDVVAQLAARERARGPKGEFLLVGILECGKCGGEMRGSGRSYLCKQCQGVGVAARTVEQKVSERVREALRLPGEPPRDAKGAIPPGRAKAFRELLDLVCSKIVVAPAGSHAGRGHDIGKRLTYHWNALD